MNEVTSPPPRPGFSNGTPSSSLISRVLNAISRSWKVITLTVLLLAVGAGGVAYYLHEPTYTSEAWLLIKARPDVILKSLDSDSQQFIRNQLEYIRSPRVLAPLAQKPAILATPELKNEQDVALALGRRIQIRQRGESDIYIVSFTSTSAEKAELIVKEVTDAYLGSYIKSQAEQENRIIKLLEDQLEARNEEMSQLRERVRALALQLTGLDPFRDNTGGNDLASPTHHLSGLQAAIIQYEVEQEFLAAQIKAAEELQAKAKTAGEPEKSSADKLVALKEEYAANSVRLRIIKEKFQRIMESAKQLARHSLELESLRSKLEQVTKIHNEISARLLAITTELRLPHRVELLKEATLPREADKWRFGHLRDVAQAPR